MTKKQRTITKFAGKNLSRFYHILFIILLAAVGTYVIVSTRAAGSGTMSITPATASVGIGSTVTLTVMADSQTTPVNAVQADLTYDTAKLEYISTNATGSAYGLELESTGGSGKVSIVRAINLQPDGTIKPLTGSNKVASVTFKAKAAGTTNVQVATSSVIFNHTDSSNVIANRLGSTITIADKTAPIAPSELVSPSQAVTSVALSWRAATDNVGVSAYRIYRNGAVVGSSSATSYTASGLAPKTAYSFSIAALDAAGNESVKSNALTVTTKPDTSPPPAPGLPTLDSRTYTSIVISWNATTDNVKTVGYNIYRDGAKVGTTTTGTSYSSTGLTPGKNYVFSVSSYDAAGNESARSAASTFNTVADTTAPSAPTELASPLQAGTSISLSWRAATDNIAIGGYNIYRNGTKVGTSTTTNFTSTGLTAGTAYSFSVSAYDTSGNESVRSNTISATINLKLGDLNVDNKINVIDLSILLDNYGKTDATRAMGDLNNDKRVSIYDLSMLLANWQK